MKLEVEPSILVLPIDSPPVSSSLRPGITSDRQLLGLKTAAQKQESHRNQPQGRVRPGHSHTVGTVAEWDGIQYDIIDLFHGLGQG